MLTPIVFRGNGPWGTGKGTNLTPAEVDGNFYGLKQRIEELKENPPSAVSIASISMSGNQITISLTNGETEGPFNVPVAAFTWMGDFAPNTNYEPWDVFLEPTSGLYLVVEPYEAPTEFDPNAPELVLMFEVPAQGLIPVAAPVPLAGVYQLKPSDAGEYLRFTEATAVAVSNAEDASFPVGFVVVLHRATAGDVFISYAPPTVVNTPETVYLRAPSSTATLIKVGANTWDLSGDLEQADA
jgi:hypothetical protein